MTDTYHPVYDEVNTTPSRIAELERKLACARAEMAEDVIARNREFVGRNFPDLLASEQSGEIKAQLQMAEDEIRALAPVPRGYVCIAVEPTDEVLNAGNSRMFEGAKPLKSGAIDHALWVEVYKAMLAAARGEK